MDKKEAEFMEKLLRTFKSEADEHLKEISACLLSLEKKTSEKERQPLIEKIFREAHSLKGAARAVNQSDIQDFCQTLENVLAAWKAKKITPSNELFDTLHATVDLMAQVIGSTTKTERIGLTEEILKLSHNLMDFLNAKDQPQDRPQSYDQSAQSTISNVPNAISEESIKEDPAKEKHSAAVRSTKVGEKTIRVSISKLDVLLQEVEEMLNLKLSARQRAAELKDMQEQFEEWKKNFGEMDSIRRMSQKAQTENLYPSNVNYSKKISDYFNWEQGYIRSLHESLNRLVKTANQEFHLVGSMVDTLLEDTKKVLMQPFATIFESLPRMIRDLSRTLDKEVNFEFQGEDIEVDKRILEELKDPLIHLIRNAIDHGIESPSERTKNKKPSQGMIKIAVSQISSNKIEFSISDDGKGINVQEIKNAVIKNGFLTNQEAQAMEDKDALMLIFHSGVSTKTMVTELSGRGVGLDIVAEKVDKLGGQLFVETKEGAGTTFKIILPTTLATFRGIQLEVNGQQYIMPTHNVLRVVRQERNKVKIIENKKIITIDGRVFPLVNLGDLLGIEKKQDDNKSDEADKSLLFSVLVVKASEKIVAFEIDKVLGEKDVLVKGLGKLLTRVKNIMAATITEWGKVIPILNPQDLVKSAIKGYRERISIDIPEMQKPVILLVEDSITSRMLLLNILESAGYTVKTAIDGEEGLSTFKNENIDLVISDVEMPRMDGFTLTEKLRAMEKGRNLPIVLCTSRDSQEDREHGIKVGANAYLEKSSFTQANLLDVIQKLL